MKLGVWLFLAFQAMLFVAWFSAYFLLRGGAITWGWSPHRELAQINTVLLLAATGSFTLAVRFARARRVAWFRTWMLMSIVLTVGFLGIRLYEYADDFALGLYPRESTRVGLYYLLTGVHTLHVVGGMAVNVWLLATGSTAWIRAAPAIVNRVEATALYWVFLSAIWLCLLVLLYVW